MTEIMEDAKWYVVHTYSGYENKVKANIEKIIENRSMQDQIHEVVVPVTDTIEIKNGIKKTVSRKIFPGYVLLKMFMNDDTWYVVRNTRGVTSFVGPGSKPVPLNDDEIKFLGVGARQEFFEFTPGDTVKVKDGPFEGSIGLVKEVHQNKQSAIVKLSIFGRETPVELSFAQIQVF